MARYYRRQIFYPNNTCSSGASHVPKDSPQEKTTCDDAATQQPLRAKAIDLKPSYGNGGTNYAPTVSVSPLLSPPPPLSPCASD
eukprot:8897126-Karenia_brevis.AAC.1